MDREKYRNILNDNDATKLSQEFSEACAAGVHVIKQTVTIRLPFFSELVVVPPLVLQRITATNIYASLSNGILALDFDTMRAIVGKVRMVLLILIGESSSSNNKAMRMILNEFHQQPAIVSIYIYIYIYCYCLAHRLGIMGGDALKLSGCMHVMHCLGKLLPATYYRKVWFSQIIFTLPEVLTILRVHAVPRAVKHVSDELSDRIAHVILLRQFNTNVASLFGNMTIDKDKLRFSDLTVLVDELKRAVVVGVRAGYLKLIHPCSGQCNCDGQTASSCYTDVLTKLRPFAMSCHRRFRA